jgi:hypothetical protein
VGGLPPPPGLAGAGFRNPQAGLERTYRAAALVRFTAFMEDFSNADGDQAQREDKPAPQPGKNATAQAAKARDARARRRATGEADIAADARDHAAARAAKGQRTGQLAPNAGGVTAASTEKVVVVSAVPTSLSVELNSFRIADKCQITVPWHDFPFLPEMVRAVLVDVFMGTVSASDFGHPQRWAPQLSRMRPMFRGYVDTDDGQFDEGDLHVQLQATSIEQRLMMSKINPFTPARRVRDGENVSDYVRRLISTVPEFSGELGDAIAVRLFPNVDPTKEPTIDKKLMLMSLQSARSQAQGGGAVQGAPPAQPGAPELGQGSPMMPAPQVGAGQYSVWDVITRACELSGLLPVYDPSLDPNAILLIPPQNIMETPQQGVKIPGGATDGFQRDFYPLGVSRVRSEVRMMVWGHNIKGLKYSRKFGRQKAPAVQVISYDPDAHLTLKARYPAKTIRGTGASAHGTKTRPGARGNHAVEEIVTRVIRGVRDQETLDRVAVALYHSISRQEVSCRVETDELASYIDPQTGASHNEDPDLLRLRPGTPIRVSVAKQQSDPSKGLIINGLNEMFERRSNPGFLRKLLRESWSRAPALGASASSQQSLDKALAVVEATFRSARLTDWFYTRVVHHKYDTNDGYSCEMELVNFVEARSLTPLAQSDKEAANTLKRVKPVAAPNPRRTAARADRAALEEIVRGGGG